jgi:MFS family permease
MVMTQVADLLLRSFGWRDAYRGIGILILIFVIPMVMLLVRTPNPSARIHETQEEELVGVTVSEAVRTKAFWMIGLAQLCFGFVTAGIALHLIPYLTGCGYSARTAAMLLSVTMGLSGLGKVMMGIFSDLVGPRIALMLDFLVNGIGCALFLGAVRPQILGAAIFITGLTLSAPYTLTALLTAEVAPGKEFGTIFGLTSIGLTLGMIAGPFTSGKLFDK